MALPPISDGTRDKQRQTPGVTPSGPLCCAAHRAGSRLAPLTRAAAANASGLRPPRSAWQATPCAGLARPQAAAPPLRGANALQASASFASALLCYPWIVQLSGSLVVWRSVPRNRPRAAANAQYGAATRRRAAVPARRRAAPTAHPRGGRAAAAWRRAGLWLSRKGGWPVAPVSPAVSGDLRPVSGGVRRGRLPCPDGHKNM